LFHNTKEAKLQNMREKLHTKAKMGKNYYIPTWGKEQKATTQLVPSRMKMVI
jgi:hypothetical protein